jgi:hypothetical protein
MWLLDKCLPCLPAGRQPPPSEEETVRAWQPPLLGERRFRGEAERKFTKVKGKKSYIGKLARFSQT